MTFLCEVIDAIDSSQRSWIDIAECIGIDKNDILKVKQKENKTKEFVYSTTQMIWKEILHYANISYSCNRNITEINPTAKLADIIADSVTDKNCTLYKQREIDVIKEIVNRVAEWKIFARILDIEQSYIKGIENQFLLHTQRNYEVIKKFCEPFPLNASWVFWRAYLDQFENGRHVIEEIEIDFPVLLQEIQDHKAHYVVVDKSIYISHPFDYSGKSLHDVKKSTEIAVRIGSENFECYNLLNVSDWQETQKRYVDTFNMLKDVKALNFAEGNDNICSVLNTLKNYLNETGDPGFVVKGYHFVDHITKLKPGMFAKDIFDDHYFCLIANDNVLLHITKCSKGKSNALYHSIRNIQIGNILHKEILANNLSQINVLTYDNTVDSMFCKECIEKTLYVEEDTFASEEMFSNWYKNICRSIMNAQKAKPLQSLSTSDRKELSKAIKQSMVAFEALENMEFPSFSYCPDDQVNELKKLIFLTSKQMEVLLSNCMHILLKGSYGSGKTFVLIKKFEQILKKSNLNDIFYLICNDQQSKLATYLKFIKSRFPERKIIVCDSNDISSLGRQLPKLSVILNHIRNIWTKKTVHIFVDEFNGSYFDKREVFEIRNLLHKFKNSYIVLALQSMEERLVDSSVNNSLDLGYQYDFLVGETSFCCYSLEYSLRCSVEINEFVIATSEVLNSLDIKVGNVDESGIQYGMPSIVVDKEYTRECNEVEQSNTISYYYNLNRDAGHSVYTGFVSVYSITMKNYENKNLTYNAYFSALDIILENVSKSNKYVICTYDEDLYNSVYYFLSSSLYLWTNEITEFMKEDMKADILLTDYASIRGFEFPNLIFLLNFEKKYLKYRMIEIFTRATSKLYVVTHEIAVMPNEIEENSSKNGNILRKNLLETWRNLKCAEFFNITYDESTSSFKSRSPDEEVVIISRDEVVPKTIQKYPWKSKVNERQQNYDDCFDDISMGIRSLMGNDDIGLLLSFLIENDIKIKKFCNQFGNNLLHLAAIKNAVNIAKFLIDKININVNSKNSTGIRPIHYASNYQSFDVMKVLIDHHADVNIKTYQVETPLHYACKNGNLDISKLLLESHADVDIKDKYGLSPLHLACFNENLDVVSLLINNHADVNIQSKQKHTPMYFICKNGNVDILRLLIDNHADVNTKNYVTPLHVASMIGHVDIVRSLVDNNANVNATDIDGMTPLHLASEEGKVDVVKILLHNKADINIKDKNSKHPLDLAKDTGVINLLIDKC